MESSGHASGLGMEVLNQSNYKIWRTCMESYLVGEDLWEVVNGDSIAPENTAENADAFKQWKKKNAKAEFVLKRSISKGLFEHIFGCKTSREIWLTLDRLFNKKNVARLQFLENELSNASQGDLDIAQLFLKIKSLCSEISLLEPDEPISESRMKRYIIRGLKPEYIPFVTSIQGWAQQPSLEEFENLLSSQESLAKQMAGMSIKEKEESVLFARKKNFRKYEKQSDSHFLASGSSSSNSSPSDTSPKEYSGRSNTRSNIKCHRCGKLGHIRRFCRVKLQESNLAGMEKNEDLQNDEEDWGRCFLAQTTSDGASIDFKNDWIVDSGCGHHLTGDDAKLQNCHPYKGRTAIVTADNSVHQVENEGSIVINKIGDDSITLGSVYHVPGVKKNLFSVSNAVDAGHFVLFGPHDVKLLGNIKALEADVIYTGKRVDDLFVLSASTSYVEKVSNNDNAHLWHARLGHLNMDKLKAMVHQNLVKGLPILRRLTTSEVCEGCQYGKAHRLPFDRSISKCKAPLERIHSDLFGPTRTSSYSGCHYMLLFIDDFTRYTWVYFLKQKVEVFEKFLDFKETVEGELGRRIKCLRTDNGGEFISTQFSKFCQQHGIRRELSCSDTPQQNGIAERKIRHLMEVCRSWLHEKNLPKALWAEGMRCAAYVINRMPLSPTNMKTPHEMMFGEKPSVKHLRVFGSICYVHVPDSKRGKLDAKARKCIFIGYDERKKGWKCMDPDNFKTIVSRDVVFDEISSFYKGAPEFSNSAIINLPMMSTSSSAELKDKQGERGSSSGCVQEQQRDADSEFVIDSQRPKRNILKPARYRDENFVSTYSCFFAGPIDDEEPNCYEKAKGVKDWENAMDEEINALMKNETWDLVPMPPNVHPISCKWIYKIKRGPDGRVDRYKARLVARGFSQKYGEDYEETFSPVAKMISVRLVLALAASHDWKLWQLDVKNAFLYGELDKDIYMEQPPGYISQSSPKLVCKLKKALYGLKQAPRAWYGKIAQYLQFCGFLACNSDPSLFVKRNKGLDVIVLLYVDDMIITGSDTYEVSKLQHELSIRFDMKNLGELRHFLGLEVENCSKGIFISQTSYARKLVDRYGLKDGKKCSTPLDVNIKLRREEGSVLRDPQSYRALVGSLIYLTITRPDIAFSVGLVSRFMQVPRKPHLEAAKRILKFVNSTLDLGLLYKRRVDVSLVGYSDADLGGDLDDRRSTSGYVFLCGGTSISWCSKKQDSVSLSTTEAEYKASALATQECVWLRRLFSDLCLPIHKPTVIFGDNQSALKLALNPVCHARTKHIELKHHFVREKVLDGTIEVAGVQTQENVADIFTKTMPPGSMQLIQAKLGLISRKSL